jgi:hypothetical protein
MDEVVVVGEASAMLWATEFMLLRELQSALERNQTPIISKKGVEGSNAICRCQNSLPKVQMLNSRICDRLSLLDYRAQISIV